jgi:hypothetical protein
MGASMEMPNGFQEPTFNQCSCYVPGLQKQSAGPMSRLHSLGWQQIRTLSPRLSVLDFSVASTLTCGSISSLCATKLAVACQTPRPAWLSDGFDAQVR